MSETLQAVRGMNDVLPDRDGGVAAARARRARDSSRNTAIARSALPLLERTELFKRSIGEFTDIVEKEMYTFDDRGGDSLTLRPEATAGIVRACISNGLLHNQRQKVWCMGPMFRYERPQKGRYRQFHQIDVEALGFPGPDVDAELILMTARLWRRLGLARPARSTSIRSARRSRARSIARSWSTISGASRPRSTRTACAGSTAIRCASSTARIRRCAEVIAGAPLITDHLDPESARAFRDAAARSSTPPASTYVVNPRLVRGLDYYSRTVFEWVTTDLGSQDAVCSGGRYDGLVAQLGGDAVPAIGWALGEERIVELMRLQGLAPDEGSPDVYLVLAGPAAEAAGLGARGALRDGAPGLRVETNCGGGSFKSQLKRADQQRRARARSSSATTKRRDGSRRSSRCAAGSGAARSAVR